MTTTATKTVLAIVGAATLAMVGYYGYQAWRTAQPKSAGPVRVVAQPGKVWIEAGDSAQTLNFDFVMENQGKTPIGLDSIEVTAFDSADQPVLRRFIDSNGFAPSIETVPNRIIEPGQKTLIFNPFHSFRPDVDLHRLQYKFSLSIPNEAPEFNTTVTVEPEVYHGKTDLALPLKGKLLVHDGHDFYAHHRRLNTEHPVAKGLGIGQNFMRYSFDLNSTNDKFEPYAGDGARNSDWFAWNKPLYAPGAGTVVAANDAEPDNIRGGQNFFKPDSVKTEPMKFYGNYVVIDHGNGEFSLLGHLQHGSLLVKTGQQVTRGQPLARVGSSGSSNNPHVHVELRTGKDLKVDGLPAYFRDFHRVQGARRLAVPIGPVDTGELLEAD